MSRTPEIPRADFKRRSRRFRTRTLKLEAPIEALVQDVSETGIGLEAVEKLRVGCDYIFRVRRGPKSLSLPGRVEWCRLIGTRPQQGGDVVSVYRAGVALVDSPAARAWRQALVVVSGGEATGSDVACVAQVTPAERAAG